MVDQGWIIVSRQYHDPPDAIGPFPTLADAEAYYHELYKVEPGHPIFGDEAGFHPLAPPRMRVVGLAAVAQIPG